MIYSWGSISPLLYSNNITPALRMSVCVVFYGNKDMTGRLMCQPIKKAKSGMDKISCYAPVGGTGIRDFFEAGRVKRLIFLIPVKNQILQRIDFFLQQADSYLCYNSHVPAGTISRLLKNNCENNINRKEGFMSIITISRGSYSRGKEVAEKLAQRLGYGCVSRDILLEASDEFNIPEIKLVRALHDAPQVIERFNNGKKRFVSFIRSSLLQHVKKDNIVYHGLAGHYFLGNIPGILKVRINADINDRVSEEMKREDISHDRALYILKKDDDERRKWGLQLYGTDTWDSRLYDVVLNIKTITVDDAIDILVNLVKKPAFQTTLESMEVINDLALASSVEAALVKIAPTVQVTCNSGTVYIARDKESGSPGNELAAVIKEVAMGTDGVREVVFQFNPAQEQNHHVNPFHNIG